MSNYTKTTDFEAKDSLPTGDAEKIIRGADFETEFDSIATAIATKADTAGPTFTGTATFETTNATTVQIGGVAITSTAAELNVLDGITSTTAELNTLDGFTGTFEDLNYARDLRASGVTSDEFDILDGLTATADELNLLDGSVAATVVPNKAVVYNSTGHIAATTLNTTGSITVGGGATVDGRYVSIDGAKLDGIEAGATADQTAAEIRTLVEAATDSNVFTDADHSKLDGIEAGATGDQTNAEIRAAVEAATDSNVFTDADHSKLDGIEALADVTDTTNVTAAGALMDSELTSEASVKALNQGVATTDSPTFAAVTVNGNVEFDGLSGTGSVTVTDILDQDDMSGNSATALATQQSIKAYVDSTVAATNELVEDTTPQLGGDLDTNGNDILFADNDKAIFGAGSDLQIFHDPSAGSIIQEAGAGSLFVRASTNIQLEGVNGENMAIFNENGSVQLYYDNAEKLATTSTGIDVTGTVTADGNAYTAFIADGTSGGAFKFYKNGSQHAQIFSDGSGDLVFRNNTDSERMRISSSGDVQIGTAAVTGGRYFDIYNTGSTATDFAITRFITQQVGSSSTTSADIIKRKNGQFGFINNDTDSAAYINFTVGASERMRLDSTGNVGIGTSSPSFGLSVESDNGSGYAALFRKSSSDPALAIQTTSGVTQIQGLNSALNATHGIAMQVSGGNVGIGVASPSSLLHLKANAPYITFEDDDNNQDWQIQATAWFAIRDQTAGEERMRIDSSGNILFGATGTATTSYGAKVLKDSSSEIFAVHRQAADGDLITFARGGTDAGGISYAGGYLDVNGQVNGVTVSSSGTERMRIDGSGNVGIGTTNAPYKLVVSNGGASSIEFGPAYSGTANLVQHYNRSGAAYVDAVTIAGQHRFAIGATEAMRIDSSGQLGVGTTSPRYNVEVSSSSNTFLQIASTSTSALTGLLFGDTSNAVGRVTYDHSNNSVAFFTNTTEKMRIDSSGNLLVGKTSASTTTAGGEINADGTLVGVRNGGNPLVLNRLTSDGTIASFRKDGTTVGTIGAQSGDLNIGNSDVGLRFADDIDSIIPFSPTANADRGGAIDLGYPSVNTTFKDLYLSGGAYIGGTAAANHLDDYEEGTWTPTYVGTTTNPSVTYDVQNGYYTKVGRKVTCHFAIRTTAITTQGVGVLQVAGLPFSCANVANIYGTGSLAFGYNFAANNGPITGYVNINSNKFTLVKSDSDDPRDGISAGVDAGSLGTSGAGNYLAMTFTYITA